MQAVLESLEDARLRVSFTASDEHGQVTYVRVAASRGNEVLAESDAFALDWPGDDESYAEAVADACADVERMLVDMLSRSGVDERSALVMIASDVDRASMPCSR